jgi:hypothetical protein
MCVKPNIVAESSKKRNDGKDLGVPKYRVRRTSWVHQPIAFFAKAGVVDVRSDFRGAEPFFSAPRDSFATFAVKSCRFWGKRD